MRFPSVCPCLLSLLLVDSANAFDTKATNGASKIKLTPMAALHVNSPIRANGINIFDAPTENLEALSSSAELRFKSNGQQQRPRNHNAAMSDTAFLRKRTANLLSMTSKEQLEVNMHEGVPLSRGMKIGQKTFNFLIDAWAFSGELEAADQAIALLARMEELHAMSNGEISIHPDVRSYTKVINALSRSMRPESGEMAQELLDKMEYLHSSGANPSAKPNTFTYTAVIEAYANSGVEGSAQKAEDVLERMIYKFERGDPDIRPNARCFNAAISAYSKSGYPGAAERAEYLFRRMDGVYMSGVEEAKPNAYNYNSLITALANSAEEGSAERARAVLDRMESCYASGDKDCKPTTVSFNAVIDAYAKSGEENAAQKAEEVVLRMEDLYEAGEDVQPNTRSFNSVINAWAKCGQSDAASRAQELLSYMTKLNEGGNTAVCPDVHSYCTVINAWARSSRPGKAEYAKGLFRSMEQAYTSGNKSLKPNVVVINAVMNACAYTHGDLQEQNRAMEIAHNLLKTLEKNPDYGTPDQVTYGTFLKVCANQMPDCGTRQQIIEVIFKKCVKDGQVGNLVLHQLKTMGPAELYQRLIRHDIDEDIRMHDLPREWWANVVEGKWRRKRNH